MANAATKVRNAFLQHSQDMTLADLKEFIKDLKSSEISMALSYLLRQRYLSRESIPNDNPKQRKRVLNPFSNKSNISSRKVNLINWRVIRHEVRSSQSFTFFPDRQTMSHTYLPKNL